MKARKEFMAQWFNKDIYLSKEKYSNYQWGLFTNNDPFHITVTLGKYSFELSIR